MTIPMAVLRRRRNQWATTAPEGAYANEPATPKAINDRRKCQYFVETACQRWTGSFGKARQEVVGKPAGVKIHHKLTSKADDSGKRQHSAPNNEQSSTVDIEEAPREDGERKLGEGDDRA